MRTLMGILGGSLIGIVFSFLLTNGHLELAIASFFGGLFSLLGGSDLFD